MEGNANQKLLIAIAIILLFILFSSSGNEPVYVQTYGEDDSYTYMSYDTISVNENTIAIISNDLNDGTYGMLIVLEYNPDTKAFEKVSERDFISDFQ